MIQLFQNKRRTTNDLSTGEQIRRKWYIEGLTAYAWWEDGVQYVGTCGTTLKGAIVQAEQDGTICLKEGDEASATSDPAVPGQEGAPDEQANKEGGR